MVSDILQPTHLLFVLVIALLVLGPKRLPEVARTLGNGIRDFRSAISGESAHDEPDYAALERDAPAPAEPDSPSAAHPSTEAVPLPPAAGGPPPAETQPPPPAPIVPPPAETQPLPPAAAPPPAVVVRPDQPESTADDPPAGQTNPST